MKAFKSALLYMLALFFLVLFGFPFVFLLFMALKDQSSYITDFWGLPDKLYLGNFQAVLTADFLVYFRNSLFVSIVAVSAVILFASLAAYVLATAKFKLNASVFMLFLLGMMKPRRL